MGKPAVPCMHEPRQAEKIANLIERLGRLLRSGEQSEGLNPVQWEVLRYLRWANRFSRTPGAVTQYLASTKGTVSQTIHSLEEKGLVTKESSELDRRSVCLSLTAQGERVLARDPIQRMEGMIEELDEDLQGAMDAGLSGLLDRLQSETGRAPFGQCQTCRYFEPNALAGVNGGPHRCGLLQAPLSNQERERICVEQQPRNGERDAG